MKPKMYGEPVILVSGKSEEAFYNAFIKSGRPLDRAKLRKVVTSLVPWLREQERNGYLPDVSNLDYTSESRRRDLYTRQVFNAYRQAKYSSIWTIIAWEVLKMIIWWIIESYLFGVEE